jgi:hypothetical protein
MGLWDRPCIPDDLQCWQHLRRCLSQLLSRHTAIVIENKIWLGVKGVFIGRT